MKRALSVLTAFLLSAVLNYGAIPTAHAAGETGAPFQPLQAWSVAPDGAVFVLDAAHVVHELDPTTLAPLRHSAPLAAGFAGQRAFMLATEHDLWVGSRALGETRRLDRNSFEAQDIVSAVGALALDPDKELFIIENRGIVAHNLAGGSFEQRVVMSPWVGNQFIGDVPLSMAVDPDARRLYVTYYGNYGSPPHNREYFVAYDLESGEEQELGRNLAHLSPPAPITDTGEVVVVVNAKNGLGGSKLLIYGSNGSLQQETPYLRGSSVAADPSGQWLYVLREGGVWALRTDTMSVTGILPILGEPPSEIVMSSDGGRLYLFGGAWMSAVSTASLQKLGAPAYSPLTPEWHNGGSPYHLFQPLEYEDHKIAFTLGSDGQVFRTVDGERSWQLIVPTLYPQPKWFTRLSISPEFAEDGVLVARPVWEQTLYRSQDAGQTWQPWQPRLAFTSDRDGNREIYTADLLGQNVKRLTDHPATDENPAWSPGWTRVVFQSNRGGNFDIFSVRAGCDLDAADAKTLCDLRQLTNDPADDLLPAWSPNGSLIAFVSLRDGNPEIYIMEPDGSSPRRMTYNRSGDWRPAWSPDAHNIVFTSDRNGGNDIFSMYAAPLEFVPEPGVEPEVEALVATPADERDAAMDVGVNLLFLSDHAGTMDVWRFYESDLSPASDEPSPYRLHKRVAESAMHPAWLDMGGTSGVFMAVETEGESDIVFLASPDSEDGQPIITSPHFDGHPAAGPVWWDSSRILP